MSICPNCACETVAGANFCGRCGVRLSPAVEVAIAAPNCRCGAPADSIDPAGFCLDCGVRRLDPAEDETTLIEIDAALAGASDRGRRHRTNEDAIVVAQAPSPSGVVSLLVVCDGVSSSSHAAQASALAAEAFRAAAAECVDQGDALAVAAARGAAAAQSAVTAIPFAPEDPPPASTLVAALVRGRQASIVWAGDSRAYRLGQPVAQLTRDDSWANHLVDRGLAESADVDPRLAHAIVNALGAPGDGETFAVRRLDVELADGDGLMLCSDGLWNYVDQGQALQALIAGAETAAAACRRLVDFANLEGGQDNISVIVMGAPPFHA